jgi:uncharacterized membrane protein YagU involved in acid resistance
MMGGLLLIWLLIKLWPVLLVGLVILVLWCLVVAPLRDREAARTRDRLRHERAQREIDHITHAAPRAMFEAAHKANSIESSVVARRRP